MNAHCGASPAGVRAPFSNAFCEAADGTPVQLRKAPVPRCAVPKRKDFLEKQGQSGILAQIFLLCGNLRLEFLREELFRTRSRSSVKYRAGNCRVLGAADIKLACERLLHHHACFAQSGTLSGHFLRCSSNSNPRLIEMPATSHAYSNICRALMLEPRVAPSAFRLLS